MSKQTRETHKTRSMWMPATIRMAEDNPEGEDGEAKRYELAFSSEVPVPRYDWWTDSDYEEVLSHDPDSVDLTWLNSGRAPFLKDHKNSIDAAIGVHERAWIEDGRGKAIVRFASDDQSQVIARKIDDGVLQNISVGYIIEEIERTMDEHDRLTAVRVTKWRPLESSCVAIPADQSDGVGLGRSADCRSMRGNSEGETVVITNHKRGSTKVDDEDKIKDKITDPAPTPDVDVEAVRTKAQDDERARCRDIMKLATAHNMRAMGEQAIEHNLSIEQFRGQIVAVSDQDEIQIERSLANLDLSANEARSYSLINAMRGIVNGAVTGFEKECSDEIGSRLDSETAGVFIPEDMMVSRDLGDYDRDRLVRAMLSGNIGQRDLNVGTGTAGGNLVATQHLGASFIEIYRNAMLLRQMGARRLTGLVGDIAIPKQTGASAASWIGTEGAEAAESELTVGQLLLSPNELGTRVDVTRKLLAQSDPSVNALIRDDLAMGVALAVDNGGLNGTGASGQPTGIRLTAGIGDVDHGTNGGAPTWVKVVEFVTDVMGANAMQGSLGWLINSPTWGKLMTTEKAASTARFLLEEPGTTMVGHMVGVTEQLPSNLTKGSGTALSAAIFGNFADCIIAEWGVMELLQDPFTQGGNTHRFRVYHMADVGVRHAGSFAAADDIITV